MALKRVRLTHTSNLKGAEGTSGEVVTVDEAVAQRWEAAGGCVILDDEADKPAVKPKDKPAVKPEK